MIRLKVKEIATAKKISQRKLSMKSGVDMRTVQGIFKNPYRNVTTVTLNKLASVLGVDASELIETVPD